MIKSLTNWLEDRTGIGSLTREALFERVPGGARWRYVWGSTLTFAKWCNLLLGSFYGWRTVLVPQLHGRVYTTSRMKCNLDGYCVGYTTGLLK